MIALICFSLKCKKNCLCVCTVTVILTSSSVSVSRSSNECACQHRKWQLPTYTHTHTPLHTHNISHLPRHLSVNHLCSCPNISVNISVRPHVSYALCGPCGQLAVCLNELAACFMRSTCHFRHIL